MSRNHTVTDALGRSRVVDTTQPQGEKLLRSHLIQGPSADAAKVAAINLATAKGGFTLLGIVHDELIIEAPEEMDLTDILKE